LKISLITPTYNCNDVIEYALNSVYEQTYDDIEHLVVDGGSSDGTVEKLKRYKVSKFISEPDNGIYDALNKGIKITSGDVIGFLHADDELASKDVLCNVASVFKSDSSISAVYGDLVYVLRQDSNRTIRYWRSKPFHSQLLSNGWMPPHPSLYVRRNFYQQIGGFNLDYKIAADYFSILSLFTLPNFKSVYIPEILVKMKLGGVSNRSIKTVLRKSLEDWMILRKLDFSIIASAKALLFKNLSKLKQFRYR
jgi:glycosyltransferase involved in cell wall biosynthesis